MAATVCSTAHQFHHFFSPDPDARDSALRQGLRPLSDFPDSARWKELEREMPGFYERLYEILAAPLLDAPYRNSGIFLTPIDFRLMPGTFLHDKPRFREDNDRIDPATAVITYVLDGERVALPFTEASLQRAASIWDEDMVREWFGKDPTKAFFYVPQVAAYQGVIPVGETDFDG